MSNFLQFIEEDIEAKKTLFSTMPTNTKTEVRKYNEKIDNVISKYKDYRSGVKKYIEVKSKSFGIKETEKGLKVLTQKVDQLEHVKFILNPLNTFFEKLGFDTLIFEISNYYNSNFNELNKNINKFLEKFELVGITLDKKDFDYTCYVKEYMDAFFEVRNKKTGNYDVLSEIFEKIYWMNPEIISHIELNLRKLIRKNEKNFINYINRHQKEIMLENKIEGYQDCLNKLTIAYIEVYKADKEDIFDIVSLAKSGDIDINNYFEESKVRISAYNSLMIEPLELDDKVSMSKFYESLEKLQSNVEEFSNYSKFMPLVINFKNEYEKQIPNINTNNKDLDKNLKSLLNKIIDNESKLEKLNKKIFGKDSNLFDFKSNINLKQLKIDSVNIAKFLYDLYKEYDKEYFKCKVLSILNKSLTISDLLYLYYSFDYFKKVAIKSAFEITSYTEIIKYSNEFDLFAMNPTNIIIDGVSIFEESNLAKVIMNRYRLDNINLTEEVLIPEDLEMLLEKIKMLLRIKLIDEGSITVEKIWFIAQAEKININEEKTS